MMQKPLLLINIIGLLGIICGFAALSSTTWMTSDLVSTGLFRRCVYYPGIGACSDIAHSPKLNYIKSMISGSLMFAIVAVGISFFAASTPKFCLRCFAACLYCFAAMVSFAASYFYKRSFFLCPDSYFGRGYMLAWSSGGFFLLASLSSICCIYCDRSSSFPDSDYTDVKVRKTPRGWKGAL